MVSRVDRLKKRKARVIGKAKTKISKSQAKSNAKSKAAVAKGKTKKAARINQRQINKNMKTSLTAGKRLGKISNKIVKAGGPARVIKTGRVMTAAEKKSSAIKKAGGGIKKAAKKSAGPTYLSTFGNRR
jgi:hypothetical protein